MILSLMAALSLSTNSSLIASTNAAKEFERLLAADEAAQTDIQSWTRVATNSKPLEGLAKTNLELRASERLRPVKAAYKESIARYPEYAPGRLAYGNFLQSCGDEAGAQAEWEKVIELDPKNAEAYHNLACRYTETGQAKKAFDFFTKAIELNPSDPVGYYNFANTLYVLRSQAAAYYHASEQEVYGKVVALYSNSMRLDPTNLSYATDLAQTYYAVRPFPAEDALKGWTAALTRARSPLEQEEVYVHMARVQMLAGRLTEARNRLAAVTNTTLLNLKSNLLRAIADRESVAKQKKARPAGVN